jgi:hypothetical protein
MTVGKRLTVVFSFAILCSLVFPSAGAAQKRDSLLNGTLAGLAVGTTTGAVLAFTDAGGPLSKHYCLNESVGSNCNANALVTTVAFAGIGAFLGAIIDSNLSSRMNWPIRRWPIDAAPIVRRDRKGMALQVRF